MKYVHYIWLDYVGVTGAVKSILIRNGKFEATAAGEFINNIPEGVLIKSRPRWIGELSRIELQAQDLATGEVRHERTIHL